ncbi:HAD-IIIA family hydrolase, partial [Planococcus sp. SIMBA_143]
MNKAVFLDRDGVINEVLTDRVKFVNTPEDFYLLEGAGEGVRLLQDAGYKIFVVTNQGGIGLGFMDEKMLHNVH